MKAPEATPCEIVLRTLCPTSAFESVIQVSVGMTTACGVPVLPGLPVMPWLLYVIANVPPDTNPLIVKI